MLNGVPIGPPGDHVGSFLDLPQPYAVLGGVTFIAWPVREGPMGWAFLAASAAIVLMTATLFLNLYPRVMLSSLSASYDLTIYSMDGPDGR